MLSALLCGQQEYAMSTTGEFQPGEIHFRIQRLNMNLTVAHLDDQHTIVGKVICGFGKHATYQVQPIVAARQAELRLMMELIWHIREILGVDIRRVRHDQVEPPRLPDLSEASACELCTVPRLAVKKTYSKQTSIRIVATMTP